MSSNSKPLSFGTPEGFRHTVTVEYINQGIQEFNLMEEARPEGEQPLDLKSFIAGWIMSGEKTE